MFSVFVRMYVCLFYVCLCICVVVRKGTEALREIRRLQGRTQIDIEPNGYKRIKIHGDHLQQVALQIPRRPFQRLVVEIAQQYVTLCNIICG